MKDTTKTNRWNVILATIICAFYLLLTIFYHHIDKYLTGPIFIFLAILIPTTFVSIIVLEIKGIIHIIRNRRKMHFRVFLLTIICSVTLLYTFLSPYRLDSEQLESNELFVAEQEGTQGFSYVKFREDRTFECASSSFLTTIWFTGNWTKKGDTIFLDFKNKKPYNLNDTNIIHKNYLIPYKELKIADSLNTFVRYYSLGNNN